MRTSGVAEASPPCPTVGTLLSYGTRLLSEAGIEIAARETAWILEVALGRSVLDLRLNASDRVHERDRTRAIDLLTRRAAREPLQYVLGTQEFCGRCFRVTSEVLIPRPETELLIDEVVRRVPADQCGVMIDIGTGSGCVAVTLAGRFENARIMAIDLSRGALDVARGNAEEHGLSDRIEWLQGDVLSPLRYDRLAGKVCVIVANPPYIPDAELDRLQPEIACYEPRLALNGGPDGLHVHRRIIAEAKDYLASGGVLALEVGIGQAEAVQSEVERVGGYTPGGVRADHAGIERIVTALREARCD